MADAAAFLALLPQFESVEPSTITEWLAEAGRTVDASWGDNQDRGQIFLAAHLMSMVGIGPEKGAAALAAVSQVSSASLSFTKDAKCGQFGLTSFGRMFETILKQERGGIYVTGTGDLPWPYDGGGYAV